MKLTGILFGLFASLSFSFAEVNITPANSSDCTVYGKDCGSCDDKDKDCSDCDDKECEKDCKKKCSGEDKEA